MRRVLDLNKNLAWAALLCCATIAIALPQKTLAVTAADWRAGNIIDDAIFYDKNSMSVGEIQAFLNGKVPVCDTAGSKPSEYGGGTRAQYGASKGYPAPFVCLKDYYENPSTKANNLHGNPIPAGGISAAQIIWNVSQQFGVSPKVMLVMLHKESDRLMIDDWPWSTQYRTAMGYGCPDSGPNYSANCNPNDYGFYTQMYSAARQFRLYANSPSSYNYIAGRNNTIQYNPDPSCGSSVVYIENQATAGLYNYTPYQPNQAALNAGYGTAPCGAYGNRNFWKLYSDWFGSTRQLNSTVRVVSGLSLSQATYHRGETISGTYVVKNVGNFSVGAGTVGICARSGGLNYDFGTIPLALGAQEARTISFSRVIDRPGVISVFICSYNDSMGGWVSEYYPYSDDTIARQRDAYVYDNPSVTTSLSLSPSSPVIGQPVTASFSVKNNSNVSVTIPAIGVAVRDSRGNNVGYPSDTNVVIAAGGTYTYSKTRAFTGNTGTYRFFITSLYNGNWDDSYPAGSPGVIKTTDATIQDNPLLSARLVVTPSSPTLHEPVTASFSVKNNSNVSVTIPAIGVAVRDSRGNNVGYPSDTNVVIAAGGTYTYSKTRAFTGNTGTYRFFITSLYNGNWDDSYPAGSPGVIRETALVMHDNPSVTTSLSLSPSSPVIGQPVTASFSVKNNSNVSVTIPAIGVAVRDSRGNNVGYPSDTNVVIAAGGTYTYSKTRAFTGNTGTYRFFITSLYNGNWDDSYPASLWGLIRSRNTDLLN